MKIHGLNKLTLLDYPDLVAATIFTGGCNFRCPFCHNGGLVLHADEEPFIQEEELFSFLKKRSGLIDGVCITGGEPTLNSDLPVFIERIKALGYKVKLDTNGYHPEIIRTLVQKDLLDMVAMDIKSSRASYAKVCGIKNLDITRIEKSVAFLKKGTIPYEFRTTVVKQLHTAQDFEDIGLWLDGASAYFLQAYKESDQVIQPGFTSYDKEKLLYFQKILEKNITYVGIRGID